MEDMQWLRGGGDAVYGRKIGFWLAMAAAMMSIAVAEAPSRFFPPGFVLAVEPRLGLAGLFFALGVLVRQGKGWASLTLMALFTLYMGIPNLAAYLTPGMHFENHPVFWTCRVILCLAAWACWMRVLWAVYRAEQQRAALTPGGSV
jgi:hypothetical protein